MKNKIAEYVAYVAAEGENYMKYFGHAGDGNLHIYTCSNNMEEGEFEKQVERFFTSIYGKTVESGG